MRNGFFNFFFKLTK